TVDWRHNLGVIRDKFQEPDVHMLNGARHHLANEHEEYREKILRIIDRYLAE
ncbi:MAG TPA: alpha/beta hydrolase, partial [Alcanivorax sp.]|nr:alpha/beta hydrolase [Alcanivorax sp.]